MGGTLAGFEGGFALHGQQRALWCAAHGQRAPHQALCAAADQTQWGKGWRQWGRTVSGHKSSLTRWVAAYSSVSAHPKVTNTILEILVYNNSGSYSLHNAKELCNSCNSDYKQADICNKQTNKQKNNAVEDKALC